MVKSIITSITPGIQVNVVNSYEAAVDSVRVTVLNNVLLPTDGKPIRAIRASPDLTTSKPSPYSTRKRISIKIFVSLYQTLPAPLLASPSINA